MKEFKGEPLLIRCYRKGIDTPRESWHCLQSCTL